MQDEGGIFSEYQFQLLLINGQHFDLALTHNTAGEITFIALAVILLASFNVHVITLAFKM